MEAARDAVVLAAVFVAELELLAAGGASAVLGFWPQPTMTMRPAETGIQSNFFII